MSSSANRAHSELIRRAEAEDRIENLPRDEQDAAWALERERRSEWDRAQALLQSSPKPLLQTSADPKTSPESSATQQDTVSLGTKRRWRFKLKRKTLA
jgi:hypothetical protein